jgi:hypothetical protein
MCVSVYKPRRWRLKGCDPSWSEIAAYYRGQNGVLVDTGRIKGHTDLGPIKLDGLVSILIDVDLFLRMVTPVLDDDEQKCTDEPREGVLLHWSVAPCCGQSILSHYGMKTGGAPKQSGLWVGRRELAWCKERCGDEGKWMDGREVSRHGESCLVLRRT